MDAQSIIADLRPHLGQGKDAEIYRRVAPLILVARLDAELRPTKKAVLKAVAAGHDPENPRQVRRARKASKKAFFNVSPYTLSTLIADDSNLETNLRSYLHAFSPNVRGLLTALDLENKLKKVDLFNALKALAEISKDLGAVPARTMTALFDELAELAIAETAEKAYEAITPRDVVPLVVDLCLAPHRERLKGLQAATVSVYDPAFGTGGMLIWAARAIRALTPGTKVQLLGHEKANTTAALGHANVLVSDVVTSNDPAEQLLTANCLGSKGQSLQQAAYVVCNPPYGESWRSTGKGKAGPDPAVVDERFSWGTPSSSDGQMMFLLQGLDRLKHVTVESAADSRGGRAVFVANGSPLFTGSAESGPSKIRRQLLENDWLDAIVALPANLFFNTGINTYLWVIDTNKPPERQGRVRLVNAAALPESGAPAAAWEEVLAQKMRKSRGDKRVELSQVHRRAIIELTYGTNADSSELVKEFPTQAFGFLRITVERPQRRKLDLSKAAFKQLKKSKEWVALGSTTARKDHDRKLAIAQVKQKALMQVLKDARRAAPKTLAAFLEMVDTLVAARRTDLVDGSSFKLSWTKSLRDAVIEHLSEMDPNAPVFLDADGEKVPDTELRDFENVPLCYGEQLAPPVPPPTTPTEQKALISAYMSAEVLPHVPEAWVDHERTKVGYEIPFTRHFYKYQPPRPLPEIVSEIQTLRWEINSMLDALDEDLPALVHHAEPAQMAAAPELSFTTRRDGD